MTDARPYTARTVDGPRYTAMVSAVLRPEQLGALTAAARDLGVSRSALIRRAVARELARTDEGGDDAQSP